MIKAFQFWLESIVEDDPLPDEIKNIAFVVNQNGNFKYLELRGYEKEININAPFFRPLEAEFFSLAPIVNKNENAFLYKLKDTIDESFSSLNLKQQFSSRKIYLLCNGKLEYLFEIKK